jgi:hypothetical protein
MLDRLHGTPGPATAALAERFAWTARAAVANPYGTPGHRVTIARFESLGRTLATWGL